MPKTPKNSQNDGKQAQNSQKCSKKMQKSQKIRKRSKTARLQPLSVTRMWAEPVGRYGDGTDDHVTDVWIPEKVWWAVCVSRKGQRSAQVWTHVLQSHFRHAQSGHMRWGTERVHLSFLRPPPEGSTLRTPASVRAFWRLFRDRSSFDPRWCFLALFGYLWFFFVVLYLFAVFWLFLVLFLWFCGPFMSVSFYFVAVFLIIVRVFVMLVSACGDVLLFCLLLFCVCCYCFVSLWSFLCFWSLCIFFGQILRL